MGLFGNNDGPKCPNCGADARHYTEQGLCCQCGTVINQRQADLYNKRAYRNNLVTNAKRMITQTQLDNMGFECISGFDNYTNLYIDWNTMIIYVGVIDKYSEPNVGFTPWLSKRGNPIRLDPTKGEFVDCVTLECPFV